MITLHCSTRKRQSKSNATSAGASLPNIFSSIPQTFSYAPQNVLYLSPPTQGFSFKPFTSPSSSEEPFFFSARVFQFKGCLCYQKKKKILPLCSFFYTSFLLSGWRDLGFSKCQNPLSGWLSDQAPPWSWSPCQAFPHLANSPFEPSLEKLACPRQQLSLCPTELHLTG